MQKSLEASGLGLIRHEVYTPWLSLTVPSLNWLLLKPFLLKAVETAMALVRLNVVVTIAFCVAVGEVRTNDESPWTWICRSGRGCIRVNKSLPLEENETSSSLASCKLTCHPQAMLWPLPRGTVHLARSLVNFRVSDIEFRSISAPNDEVRTLTQEAAEIFRGVIAKSIPSTSVDVNELTSKVHVAINIDISSEDSILRMTTDESYSLSVTTQLPETSVNIVASTFFGARHALETLSQLMAWDESVGSMIMLSHATITDSPAFVHRGVMIDSSRNFITIDVIKKIIDAMSYDKLNVLHWHLTDTQSFPLVSPRQPLMALYGAYSPEKVYRPEDIQGIVRYAMVRGVKVVPELNTPAHTGSGWEWGEKNGLGQLVLCVNKEPVVEYCYQPPCGLLNPVNENIYPILNNIYRDMSELFQSDIFHMGGDEVKMRCWNESQEVVDWLTSQGKQDRSYADFIQLWLHFQRRAVEELDKAYGRQLPIVLWTSGLTEDGEADKYLDKDRYIIHIWTTATDQSIANLYRQGFQLILSNVDAWYLDCGYGSWMGGSNNNWCSPYISWERAYMNSPRRIIQNFGLSYNSSQILGGETAMWSEQVDSATIEGKMWPRSSALAERLWTDPDTDWKAAESRMVHHRERIVGRGILADALQPEWCHQNEGHCLVL